jgi:raffinose/stachyose/melibiose transport system permease protein
MIRSSFRRAGPSATANAVSATVLRYGVLALFASTTLFPLVWMGYSSFKTNIEISQSTFALPSTWKFDNYVNAWQTARIGDYFFNSIFVSAASVLSTALLGAAAAFILAKFRFPGRKSVYGLFIVGMLIPLQAVLVPLFSQMRDLRLLDTYRSLILVYTAFGLPTTIFLMESFIAAFPDSIMEASIIDGASAPRIFLSVILPMSGPVVATTSILNFLTNWKEFSFALVFLTSEAKKTLPLGLYNFLGAYTADYAGLMAALTIATLPTLILYLLLQDRIITGMTAGAVKG